MTDFFKTKENEFYIELKEERYYIPGEDISGDVILDLKKATKTNNIKVALEGVVEIAGRSLSLFTRSVVIAESLDGQRSYYLEPHTHRFPFRITIPNSKTTKVPSTLEIPRVLKVYYKLTATYNKTYTVLEKLCPTTSVTVNILEDINVEKDGLIGEKRLEKEWKLSNKMKGKVNVIIGKRAAVKGDVIPISVSIEYNGVLNKDKGVSAQLLRYVYYGRHKSEVYGPKIMREISANLYKSEGTTAAKNIDMNLQIPSQLCPTVDKSGQSFKIKYTIRVKVNLNEPNRPENKSDIATFNVPFILGTYPKLSFNIDDDYNDDEEQDMDAAEYTQMVEKMKNMDFLESDITATNSEPNSPEMTTQDMLEPPLTSVQRQGTVTHIDPTMALFRNKPLPLEPLQMNKPNTATVQPVDILSPSINNYSAQMSPSQPTLSPVYNSTMDYGYPPVSPVFVKSNSSIRDRPTSIHYPSPSRQNTMVGRQTSLHHGLGRQESLNHGLERQESLNHGLGRRESVRWVAPPPPPPQEIVSMPTPFVAPPAPPLGFSPVSFPSPYASYPPQAGGFPIPEHDPHPIHMPSPIQYQQPPYPYYPPH